MPFWKACFMIGCLYDGKEQAKCRLLRDEQIFMLNDRFTYFNCNFVYAAHSGLSRSVGNYRIEPHATGRIDAAGRPSRSDFIIPYWFWKNLSIHPPDVDQSSLRFIQNDQSLGGCTHSRISRTNRRRDQAFANRISGHLFAWWQINAYGARGLETERANHCGYTGTFVLSHRTFCRFAR